MKKVMMMMVIMALMGGVAFAASLSIPWFADNAKAGDGWPPKEAGVATIVYLKNNTADPIECKIAYYSNVGDPLGPFPGTANWTQADVRTVSGGTTLEFDGTKSNSAAENAKLPSYTGSLTDIAHTNRSIDGLNSFVIPALSTVGFRPNVFATKSNGLLGNATPTTPNTWTGLDAIAGGQESPVAKLIPDRPVTTTADVPNGSITVEWEVPAALTDVGDKLVQGFVATCASNMSYAHLLPPGF